MKKGFAIKLNGVTSEYMGIGFVELLNLHKEGMLYLQRYDAGPGGIGWVFRFEALIGDLSTPLTYDDYYNAYDKII